MAKASVMLLHPVSDVGQKITKTARGRMLDALPFHLQIPLVYLGRALVIRLADTEMVINDDVSDDDWQELVLFAYANRTYAEPLGPLVKLANFIKHDGREGLLTDVQKKVMTEKVLQHKSWKEVAANSELERQKHAIQLLRDGVIIILRHYEPDDLVRRITWIKSA